jgi:arylsulfatase A-like enzyme/tetratricopeptide (TPR) repeat protein
MSRRQRYQALLVLFACAVAACRGDRPQTNTQSHPNVLLVTIDTLRADHIGAYGYAGTSTPTIDGLAARGVRFTTAIAHAPLTGPSHASILTGQTPLGHGFRNNSGYVMAPTVRLAAEDFRQAGYRTAAFISGFPLDRRFGFDRGFDTYDDRLPKGNDRRRTPYVERFADATTDAVLRWMETSAPSSAAAPSPWFVWVHYYDPHAPYEAPGPLGERFRQAPYDGEIAFVDNQLGRLLQALDEKNETSRTVVLVTADHGESLGEHGEGTHGIFVYDATLRVPWIMSGPQIPTGRVSGTVARGVDVLPTLLDYAGLPPRTDIDGRSLRLAAEGKEMSDAPAYAESVYPELELGWAPLHAWRTSEFKFIKAPRPELYDLKADAAETTNRISDHPTQVSEFGGKLEAALRVPPPTTAPAPSVDPEAAERLRALGYASGGRVSRRSGVALRDPKDGVRLLPRLNRGMSAARTNPDLAISELTTVIQEDPGLFMARRTRAVAYAAAGRHDLAIADLRVLDKEGQLTPEDAIVLGDNLRSAGRLEEASLILERAQRENPAFPQPLISLAEVRIQEHRYDDAAALCERVLKTVPDHIEALRRLGDLALLREDLAAAGTRYGRIVELDRGDVAALSKLGVVRMRTGRQEEGIRVFRQAVEGDPRNPEALLYLAGALASLGRHSEALPYFERALDADPRSTMTLNGLGLTRLAVGDRRGAAAAFRESLRLDPQQADIARTLADLGRGASH